MADMVFFYGGYSHAPNSVGFQSINRTIIRGDTQRALLLRVNWTIKGKLVSQISQGDLMEQLGGLLTAYSVDGYSAGMSGTPFVIDGSVALGGARITSPVSHGAIMGAEGVTYLYYTVGLEADFPWAATPFDIMHFEESLTFTNNNGGPIFVERIPAVGDPILQQVTTNSWFYVTQRGSLRQPGPNPNPMQPIFPLNFIRTAGGNGSTVTYQSPKMIRGFPVEYGVEWKYEFINNTALIAWPNVLG